MNDWQIAALMLSVGFSGFAVGYAMATVRIANHVLRQLTNETRFGKKLEIATDALKTIHSHEVGDTAAKKVAEKTLREIFDA